MRNFAYITIIWTTWIGANTIHERSNTDPKLFDIANCKTSKNVLFVVENAILKRYY